MAARAAARLRRSGGIDPTGAWDEIDAAGLAVLGIGTAQVADEIARRALQMARLFRKQKNRPGLRDALLLADAQPRKGIAARALHGQARKSVRLDVSLGRSARP